MKSKITKVITALTLTSLLSTSVFANETLNRIIADAQDGTESSKVISDLASAMSKGEIQKGDLEAYLKENSSPRAYKEIQTSINSGDLSGLASVVAKSDGANFKGNSCNDSLAHFGTFVAIGSALAAIATGVNSYNLREDAEAEKRKQAGLNQANLNLQAQIRALEAQGINNGTVDSLEQQVINNQQAIALSVKIMKNLENDANADEQTAIKAAALSGVSYLALELSCGK